MSVFSYRPGVVPPPNAAVFDKENAIEKSLARQAPLQLGSLGLEDPQPVRPGYGTRGKAVTLWANHFELSVPKDLPLYRYGVEIAASQYGKPPMGGLAKWIILLLLEQCLPQYGGKIATDYKSTLISLTPLELNNGVFQVKYRSEIERKPPSNATTYNVRVRPVAKGEFFNLSGLIDFLASDEANAVCNSKAELIQALNIIIGHHPKSSLAVSRFSEPCFANLTIAGNMHYPIGQPLAERRKLSDSLEAVRGYFISARAATGRLLLNVQVKTTNCFNEGPLCLLMSALCEEEEDIYHVNRRLKGLRVRMSHLVDNAGKEIPQIKPLSGVAGDRDGRGLEHPPKIQRLGASATAVEFCVGCTHGPALHSPEYISVSDFAKRTYNKILKKPKLPVVNVGTLDTPSYLAAEFCFVLPGQTPKRKLSPSETEQLRPFAVRKPVENAKSIANRGLQVLGAFPGATLSAVRQNFNIHILPNIITVPARVLKSPAVLYRNGKRTNPVFGSWNLSNCKFYTATTLRSWSYLSISTEISGEEVWHTPKALKDILQSFRSTLAVCGINLTLPTFPGRHVRLKEEGPNDNEIAKIFSEITNKPEKPSLMLVILPHAHTVIYNTIKLWGDIKKGIHTVAVIGSKFAKPNNIQYFANVALKFNLKLGGISHALEPAELGIIGAGKTMVVGIDVGHPSGESAANAPSIAAMVASVDRLLGQWPASVSLNPRRQEMVENLKEMLKSRLDLWKAANKGNLPVNIMVFRDGVSEGQYDIVLREELPLLRAACRDIYPPQATQKDFPRISIIIVGKRHRTRFYPTDAKDMDTRSRNPQNGTVVDRGLTEARQWSFFIQSHTALQGTARPAHYYVAHNEVFGKQQIQPPFNNVADVVEALSHNMCYLSGRATKAVSIPPAVYFADLVCERARRYLSEVFNGTKLDMTRQSMEENIAIHPTLKNTMFYI